MKFVNRYGVFDRALHRLAFKTSAFQVRLAEIEYEQFEDELKGVRVERPVFIVSLPRAGTTLLLDLCVASGQFATHDYSNMPFIQLPLFWSKYSSMLRRNQTASIERAHADGVEINIDTAEAFEEVLWKTFWPEKYLADRISPWNVGEKHERFENAFKQHIQKLIFLKQKKYPAAEHYISKNNANIARTGYLRELFPDAIQILLFRDPVLHAQSLLKQHRQFVTMHHEDPFSLEYMKGIGHHDFGLGLKCLNIGSWLSTLDPSITPDSLDFWLQYWIAAYGEASNKAETVNIPFCFETLYKKPEYSLRVLAENLPMTDRESLVKQSGKIREPGFKGRGEIEASKNLLEKADSIYEQLCMKAINA